MEVHYIMRRKKKERTQHDIFEKLQFFKGTYTNNVADAVVVE